MRFGGQLPGVDRKAPANTRIMRRARAMRRGQRCGDVRTRAETRVDEPSDPQCVERGIIMFAAVGLDEHGRVMSEPEPVEILDDSDDEFRPAARLVEIFDPQQELASARTRPAMCDDRAVGMAEVKPASRRRGKSRDDHRHHAQGP